MASIPSTPWNFLTPNPSNSRRRRYHLHKFLLSSPSNEATPSSSSSEAESEIKPADPVKLAFAKAQAYKKSKAASPPPLQDRDANDRDGKSVTEVSPSVKLAMERAGKYKKNKEGPSDSISNPLDSGKEEGVRNIGQEITEKSSKKEELKVSSIDFMGLGFSEKKNYRSRPPGLVPIADPLLEGDIPEVEIIVGDASNFGVQTPEEQQPNGGDDNEELYKPRVSSWGVFPRPNNISKTFGGGRKIRPGEALVSAEDKAAKEKRTKELIAAYKRKMGITVDTKTKSECDMALKEGIKLMDLGKLKEALPFYEKVMKDMVFQSELHGLAALQWSICQDSLRRSDEARAMYEKLQSHPNAEVSKKAKQFAFSFQAMEMMKVQKSSLSGRLTGYEGCFEAFIDRKTNYTPAEEQQNEDSLKQILPYVIFLLSPVFIVFLVAATKSVRF